MMHFPSRTTGSIAFKIRIHPFCW